MADFTEEELAELNSGAAIADSFAFSQEETEELNANSSPFTSEELAELNSGASTNPLDKRRDTIKSFVEGGSGNITNLSPTDDPIEAANQLKRPGFIDQFNEAIKDPTESFVSGTSQNVFSDDPLDNIAATVNPLNLLRTYSGMMSLFTKDANPYAKKRAEAISKTYLQKGLQEGMSEEQLSNLNKGLREEIGIELDSELGQEINFEAGKKLAKEVYNSIANNPGASTAAILNEMTKNPELLATPGGFISGVRAVAAISKSAGPVTKTLAGMTGSGVTAAMIEAGIETREQLNRFNEVKDAGRITLAAGVGGAAGFALGPLFLLGKPTREVVGRAVKNSGKTAEVVQKEIADKVIKEGKSPTDALDEVEDIIPTLEDPLIDSKPRGETKTEIKNKVDVDLDDNIPSRDISKVPEGRKRTHFNSFTKGASELLSPISTVLENIDPRLQGLARNFEGSISVRTANHLKRIDPFVRATRAIPKAAQDELDLLVSNGKFDEARDLLQRNAERLSKSDQKKHAHNLINGFDEAINLLEELAGEAESAGIEFNRLENFWPRRVKDLEGLKRSFGVEGDINLVKAIQKVEAKEGRKLTPQEEYEVINSVLAGRQTSNKMGQFKERRVEEVTPENKKFYAGFRGSLEGYIQSAVENIETQKFFGKNLGENNSIGKLVKQLQDEGKINADDFKEIQAYVQARTVDSKAPSSQILQNAKNIFYAATIAKIRSAVTQFGDLALSAYYNGVYNTTKSVGQTLRRKVPLTAKDIGVVRISAEIEDAAKTAKFLDTMFRWSGFNMVDQFGKTTSINASRIKAQKSLLTNGKLDPGKVKRFRNTYAAEFGSEIDDLIGDIANNNPSENMALFLFNRLSDTQPISLAEMPLKYIQIPNGRILYMLKSFTIKQVDLIRRTALRDISDGIATGNKKQIVRGMSRIMEYTALFMAANMGTDVIKDFMLGREWEMSDSAYANLLRAYGLSKFNIDRAKPDLKRGKIGKATAKIAGSEIGTPFAIGLQLLDKAGTDIDALASDEDFEFKLLENFPIAGDIIQEFTLEK